jgi:hypothetical protein
MIRSKPISAIGMGIKQQNHSAIAVSGAQKKQKEDSVGLSLLWIPE